MEFEIQKAQAGVYTLLGFAQKSGSLFSGTDMVMQALSKHRVRLILLAWDLSENSYTRFCQHWQQHSDLFRQKVQVWRFGAKQQLGQAIGKPERGILALGDENLCRGIESKLQQLQVVSSQELARQL